MYHLSRRSLSRLEGVHEHLRRVVEQAICITSVDFTVLEGLRSRERQEALVRRGASTTMRSRHLTGHAVDLAPLDDGEVSWQWADYFPLACAMQEAAALQHVPLVWGGCWSRLLPGRDPRELQEQYIDRKRAMGERPFLDGPHFQLPWEDYPA